MSSKSKGAAALVLCATLACASQAGAATSLASKQYGYMPPSSQLNIAPQATIQAMHAQSISGQISSLVNRVPTATLQSMTSQAIAGRTASLVNIAPVFGRVTTFGSTFRGY